MAVDGTLALMRFLAGQGTHAVFLSSSQVFDGETQAPDEQSPTAPKNTYGRQKLAVEQAIAREGLPVAVLRVAKVLADRPVGVFAVNLADVAAITATVPRESDERDLFSATEVVPASEPLAPTAEATPPVVESAPPAQ